MAIYTKFALIVKFDISFYSAYNITRVPEVGDPTGDNLGEAQRSKVLAVIFSNQLIWFNSQKYMDVLLGPLLFCIFNL